MITEAIVLAGGLGTRLRDAVPRLPKCLAPAAGRPFIDYVLAYLASQQISHFILALGYQADAIQEHIRKHYSDWNISFSVEEEPLGTGGAIAKAGKLIKNKYAVVTNGDTLYKAAILHALPILERDKAECVLFIKPMENVARYGAVQINETGLITAFLEKKFFAKGWINGGVYVLDMPRFLKKALPEKFSFEKDYLEAGVQKRNFYAVPDDAYFIDIGIPEDYERAGRELPSL